MVVLREENRYPLSFSKLSALTEERRIRAHCALEEHSPLLVENSAYLKKIKEFP